MTTYETTEFQNATHGYHISFVETTFWFCWRYGIDRSIRMSCCFIVLRCARCGHFGKTKTSSLPVMFFLFEVRTTKDKERETEVSSSFFSVSLLFSSFFSSNLSVIKMREERERERKTTMCSIYATDQSIDDQNLFRMMNKYMHNRCLETKNKASYYRSFDLFFCLKLNETDGFSICLLSQMVYYSFSN